MTISFPILSLITFLPLLGVFMILFIRGDKETVAKNARSTALLTSIFTFAASLYMYAAFDKTSGQGTLTAGNSTGLSDGASAVLLASEDWASARGLKAQAYLTHAKVAAVDFVRGEGLLMAPTIAVPRMLDAAGLTLQDFDFYEIHEAFAAQVLCTLRAWENVDYCKNRLGRDKPLGSIDMARFNVNGSSLALGHPFAATGTRIVATLAKMLEEKGGGRGLISICTAGGMGVTAIVERP